MKNKNNTQPLVSVVMPAYNSEKYIAEAIESVLNQTYQNFEFIILDDGSTDTTLNIINKYAKRDSRIKLMINEKNRGNWGTRNKGIKLAKGKYIITHDSDDISDKRRFEKQVEFMENNPEIGVSGTNIEIIDSNGVKKSIRKYPSKDEDLRKMIFFYSPFANPTTIFRSNVFEKSGYFDETLKVSGDLDLWFRIGSHFKLANISEELVKYRVHEKQLTSSKLKLMETIANKVRWKNSKNPEYKFGIKEFIYNFAHKISIYIIPSKFKLWLFAKIRGEQ